MEREEWTRQRAYELWEQAGRPDDASVQFWLAAEREAITEIGEPPEAAMTEVALDEALDESFPASDPPGYSGITGPAGSAGDGAEAKPTSKSRFGRSAQTARNGAPAALADAPSGS